MPSSSKTLYQNSNNGDVVVHPVAPGINQDATQGYFVGCFWIDSTNSVLYTCMDATEGAAVWTDVSTDNDTVYTAVNYSTSEQTLNETWTGGETIYRKVIDFGTMPNATSKSVAHGISNLGFIVDYHFISDDTTNQFPVPHAEDSGGQGTNIRLYFNDTNIAIETGTNYRTHTGTCILTYTKSA